MNISALKELLGMLPDEMDVFVQTNKSDFLQPLEKGHLWVSNASYDEKYKELHQSKLCITAFISAKDQ